VAKLAANEKLRAYVQDRLAGTITRPDGTEVPGPSVRWAGRRHGPRQDHRWAKSWSPERISKRLVVDFPDDESMRVSHQAIYQALFVQGRGALRRELVAFPVEIGGGAAGGHPHQDRCSRRRADCPRGKALIRSQDPARVATAID
jgi:hypothetical protein